MGKEVIESITLDDLIENLKDLRKLHGNSYVFKADNEPFQTSSHKEFDTKTFRACPIKTLIYDYGKGVIIR